MKKDKRNDDLRPEYDLSKLRNPVRGKYAKRYAEGTNIVALEPELAKIFPSSNAVNDALRRLITIEKR